MADPASSDEPARLLIVSTDADLVDGVKLSSRDHLEVVDATDARSAFQAMNERVPSVVVVSIQAGSAGGFALAREMAADQRLASIPLLMLLERDQDEWLARQAGAAATRTLPISGEELVGAALALIV